jgi:5'-phosphate synthase pdxT subunit
VTTGSKPTLVGVLAMQGAYREHQRALEAVGARTRLVRSREDLVGLDGLVIPGGESTTMQILLERVGLLEPVRSAVLGGLPALGTCAGMILLAGRITDGRPDQRGIGALDIAVRRNAYGRQVDSFEADLDVAGLDGGPFPGIFIRAPVVEDPGPTQVLARHQGRPVAVRQGHVMALAFHPELSSDRRLHEEFLKLVRGRKEQSAA